MRKIGVQLVEHYPKCSQDLNAIENAWKLLKDRLNETLPVGMEKRADFIVRLRNAVAWVNKNKRDDLLYHCNSQKERAEAVLWNGGARTKY